METGRKGKASGCELRIELDAHAQPSPGHSRLERHLRSGLSDGLGSDGSDGGSGLDLCAQVANAADLKELSELVLRHTGQVVDGSLGVV